MVLWYSKNPSTILSLVLKYTRKQMFSRWTEVDERMKTRAKIIQMLFFITLKGRLNININHKSISNPPWLPTGQWRSHDDWFWNLPPGLQDDRERIGFPNSIKEGIFSSLFFGSSYHSKHKTLLVTNKSIYLALEILNIKDKRRRHYEEIVIKS